MEVAYIQVTGTQAIPSRIVAIPAGIVGATVRMSYADDPWGDLIKNVVFRHDGKTVTVLNAGKTVNVPPELVSEPSEKPVLVGVCGVDKNDTVMIPTLWARISPVYCGADLNGDPSADPALPVWAQLQQEDAQIRQEVADVQAAVGNAQETADKALAANPDWDQNDPTQPDYIKNRTHFIESAGGGGERVHQLSERFIPDTIARSNWVSNVQRKAEEAYGLAWQNSDNMRRYFVRTPGQIEVGQTIRLKSVEEDRTVWEAVDLPTDEHINSLIDTKLGVIENGAY